MNTRLQHTKHRLTLIRFVLLGSLIIITGVVRAQEPHFTVRGSVFGGGNKANVKGSCTVTIYKSGQVVNQDVYGGGALANVNVTEIITGTGEEADTAYSHTPDAITTVNILKGTIGGNVYGGGLGDSIGSGYVGNANVAALVYGKVYVNISNDTTTGGPTLNGSVFGCNNLNGTPLDSVFVNIYKTAHTTGDHNNQYPGFTTMQQLENSFPNPESSSYSTDSANYVKEFAIKSVYGGGNKASYKPEMNAGNPATPKCTTVHVYGCTENTIQTIYGGGNAANVGDTTSTGDTIAANTRLIIEGGRYDQVFGGGNGYSASGNHDMPYAATEGGNDCQEEETNWPCPDYNPGANIYGSASTEIQGGLYRQVFGGSNQYGDVATVALSIDNQCEENLLIYESFGGANEAEISSNVETTLLCSNYEIGSFYGGSNKANINGNVTLNVRGGTYTNVFGGSKGVKESNNNAGISADIEGNVTLNLHGGTMVNAFGGSDANGSISGFITVNVWDTVSGCHLQVDTIYGGGQDAAYAPDSVAGKKIVSPLVNLWNGTVGHAAIKGCVFGGGKGAGAKVTAHPKVVIGDTITGHPEGNIITILNGNVFGGGNAAEVDGIDSVLMLKANSVVSNLFGGGNAAIADTAVVMMTVAATVDTIFGGGNLAGLLGTAEINVSAGTVKGGIYGGCNASGNVAKDIVVNVLGGTVGADNAHANIHGGGYGAGTSTTGLVTVNYGNNPTTHSDFPKVYGDIYGGSALGEVNAGNDTTMVNVLNGTVYGDIYGGGLGDNSNAALVNGKVYVNIGGLNGSGNEVGEAIIEGSVYGCNNANGSPQDSVFVNVYKTNHNANNSAINPSSPVTFAIANLYGGGNQAPYIPTGDQRISVVIHTCDNTIEDVFGGGDAASVAKTSLVVNGGRFNRIFAGGNGENDPADIGAGGTTLVVRAGKIHQLFGGSNMQGSINGPIVVDLNHDNDGCVEDIDEFFGGSNEAVIGTELNPANLVSTIACGVTTITDVYGGSNKAEIYGNVTLNINGGTIVNAYGGSKGDNGASDIDAKIHGDVNLNLYGGTIRHAFGGSNLQGNVFGQITVNVLDTVRLCPLALDTVYGGGNLASYTPTSSSISSPLVNIINGTVNKYVYGGGLGESAIVKANPVVKIGYDASMATLLTPGATGSIVATGFSIPDTVAIVTGEVYGGGDAAPVDGSTSVTLQKTNSSVQKLFGGGNQAGVSGASTVTMNHGFVSDGVYGGCNTSGTVGGNIVVGIKGGTIGADGSRANVHGGGYGKDTKTGANVEVTIDSLPNFASPVIWGDVYGGSALGSVNSSTDVVNTSNHTYVTLNKGTVNGDIYGGGLGQKNGVNGATSDIEAKVWSPVEVTVTGGNVTGYYDGIEFTGGRVFGCNNLNGAPQVSTLVDIQGGFIERGVFGGGNLANAEGISPHVVVRGGRIFRNVYGGGAYASTGPTFVDVLDGTVSGDVYGGCLGGGEDSNGDPYSPAVVGNTTVKIGSSTGTGGGNVTFEGGAVYGGNDAYGSPTGTATVKIYQTAHNTTNEATYREDDGVNGAPDFAIGGVYGGGNAAEFKGVESYVFVYGCGNTIQQVVGGGNQAATKSVHTMIEGGRFHQVFGGGNGFKNEFDPTDNVPADVNGNVELKIHGGTIGQVFSAGNYLGSVSGDITLEINKTECSMYIGEVYGGSNEAAGKVGTIDIGCTGTLVEGNEGHIAHPERIGTTLEGIGTVYGGSNAANVSNSVLLNINDGIINKVFGGNNDKDTIQGTITVNIEKTGTCDWYVGEVYGGGNHAPYGGTPEVNIIEGTIYRNVYGGGNDITADTLANTPRGVKGSNVVMTGGTVLGGVYGGCNKKGSVATNSLVTIQSGTIGSQAQLNDSIVAVVFGGGLGVNTKVAGNVIVNFGNRPANPGTPSTNPKLYGDIYGGSALGSVNTSGSDTTTVNVLDGTLFSKTDTLDILVNNVPTGRKYVVYTGGNVFGGGLGEENVSTKGLVYGKIEVNIGAPVNTRELNPINDTLTVGNATIGGNVYGCNNTGGSPQDDVTVNVYRTHRRTTDEVNIRISDPTATYSIANVFGGGNRANYTATDKTATVNIISCYNSIKRVFGGGNAAAAPNVHTNIQGGRFAEVFGGGNGEVSAANITGDVELEIHGGEVGEFFVGSNQNGTISGTSDVTVDQASGCEEIYITEFYCGGKYADFVGDINATITCSEGMHVTNLYGGCKEAHVKAGNGGNGNVHLVVNGGIFENVYGGSKGTPTKGADIEGNVLLEIFGGTVTNAIFGGSNVKGAIGGTITVNVEQKTGDDYCPLDVSLADVYGGGNQADYPGVPTEGGPITGSNTHTPPYDYPQVNIKNATVKNVFGGGLKAEVTGNPQVHIKKGSKILGNVYGGGNMGEVNGNPKVIINGKQTN